MRRSASRILAASIIVIVCASGALAEDNVLACTGPFAKDSSHPNLVKAFGKTNVTAEEVPGAEGETLKASVIFGTDPARRIEVLWFDEAARKRPSTIRVRQGSAVTAAGVGLGTPLSAVEAANGKPVTLYGFEWDMGGWVTGYGGGALGKLRGGCVLQLRFEPGPAASETARAKVAGDRTFSSASSAMKAAKPVVSELALGWAE